MMEKRWIATIRPKYWKTAKLYTDLCLVAFYLLNVGLLIAFWWSEYFHIQLLSLHAKIKGTDTANYRWQQHTDKSGNMHCRCPGPSIPSGDFRGPIFGTISADSWARCVRVDFSVILLPWEWARAIRFIGEDKHDNRLLSNDFVHVISHCIISVHVSTYGPSDD